MSKSPLYTLALLTFLATVFTTQWSYFSAFFWRPECAALIGILATAYYFGIKRYLKYNTPTAIAVWVSFSFVGGTEFSNIWASQSSHRLEEFLAVFGFIFSSLTATILIDNLRRTGGNVITMWHAASHHDKAVVYTLGAIALMLIVAEGLLYSPISTLHFGDDKWFEIAITLAIFYLDISAYKAIKCVLQELPDAESMWFWIGLTFTVSVISIYQLLTFYIPTGQWFSIGLFTYLENTLFFGAVMLQTIKSTRSMQHTLATN